MQTATGPSAPVASEVALAQLARAMAAEMKFGYTNLQGKQARFGEFALEQALGLREHDRCYEDGTYAHLLAQLEGYGALAPRERQERLQQCRLRLLPYLRALGSRGGDFVIALCEDWTKDLPGRKTRPVILPVAETWEDASVRVIKGVGEKLAADLARAGVSTIGHLLRYYPRRHLDYSQRTCIRDLKEGITVTIWGQIHRSEVFSSPRNKKLTIHNVTISDGTGQIKVSWFYGRANKFLQDQYKARFPAGNQVLVSGTVKRDSRSGRFALERPEAELLGECAETEGKSLHLGRIVPVYPLVAGLNLKFLRRAIAAAIEQFLPQVSDPLPLMLRHEYGLLDLPTALREFHFPSSTRMIERARHRLVFDELFYLQLGLLFRRERQNAAMAGLVLDTKGLLLEQFVRGLPFQLTGAQQRVFSEVARDLTSGLPMNRLVQGDVGSGKTVVAIMTLLSAVQHGYQGALMAPTEVLAAQHYRKLQEWLTPLGIPVELVLGQRRSAARGRVLRAIADGSCPIAVGTHALIQEKVEFRNLGLVIIDEQHRFGVEQRARLRAKGENPQVLTMSATPIPRTLALTLHGDLDLSTVDEMPPGRQPVVTELASGAGHRRRIWQKVRQQVLCGRQIYVVFPLIEESEKLDIRAATVEAQRLQDSLPNLRVGLLHGRQAQADKETVISAFRQGQVDILVSTTVIEVGIDVPNATVMVIANAERFGLAQLHQLRGRVGRGAEHSYCFLLPGRLGAAARERLEILTTTNDGFAIAEKDLRLRGPGEYLGTRQSGLPDFVLADLIADTPILEAARSAAQTIIGRDPRLEAGRQGLMRRELMRRWHHRLEWLGLT